MKKMFFGFWICALNYVLLMAKIDLHICIYCSQLLFSKFLSSAFLSIERTFYDLSILIDSDRMGWCFGCFDWKYNSISAENVEIWLYLSIVSPNYQKERDLSLIIWLLTTFDFTLWNCWIVLFHLHAYNLQSIPLTLP